MPIRERSHARAHTHTNTNANTNANPNPNTKKNTKTQTDTHTHTHPCVHGHLQALYRAWIPTPDHERQLRPPKNDTKAAARSEKHRELERAVQSQ